MLKRKAGVARLVPLVGLSEALVGDMRVHSVVPVQGIRGALTVLEASVEPLTHIGARTPVWKPRVTVEAGHDLVVVAGSARDRGESDGQSNTDRDKGLVHDSPRS